MCAYDTIHFKISLTEKKTIVGIKMEIEYQVEYRYQVRLYLKCKFSFIGKKKKKKRKEIGEMGIGIYDLFYYGLSVNIAGTQNLSESRIQQAHNIVR